MEFRGDKVVHERQDFGLAFEPGPSRARRAQRLD
jgi:hypothetical protein